jgi:hypothetical protein
VPAQFTLPLRFLTLTAHLVAVLCIVLDLVRNQWSQLLELKAEKDGP